MLIDSHVRRLRPERLKVSLDIVNDGGPTHAIKVYVEDGNSGAVVSNTDAIAAGKNRHLNPGRHAWIDVLQAVYDILPSDHRLVLKRSGRGEKVPPDVRGQLQLWLGGHAVASLFRSSIK